MNCQAPDTGNMELLHLLGTEEQKQEWLAAAARRDHPLGVRDDRARPSPAATPPTSPRSIDRDGDEYVINGRKWWTSGAADPRCKVLIVMGKTDPEAATHRQQSMVIVPMDTPGVEILRSLPVFGRQDQHGHCEVCSPTYASRSPT